MLTEPQCSKRRCVHFIGAEYLGKGEETEVVTCEAFPRGIPEEIAYGDNKHTKPFKGDHGIQYEEDKGAG